MRSHHNFQLGKRGDNSNNDNSNYSNSGSNRCDNNYNDSSNIGRCSFLFSENIFE